MSEKKNKGGRPPKYKEEYCQMLIDFFDVEPYEDVELPHYKDGQRTWSDFKRVANDLPTLSAFAKKIGVGVSTVYDWINEKHASYQQEFSETYTRKCKDLQKWMVVQNGLQGTYNPTFAKFVMMNISDWRDRNDTTTDDKPIEQIVMYYPTKKNHEDKNEKVAGKE